MNRVWGMIPAAGVGQRFGGDTPKQYLMLDGVALLERALTTICSHPAVNRVIVGLAGGDQRWQQLSFTHAKFAGHFVGGEQRFDTVRIGLQTIVDAGGGADLVLVHDAARPLLGTGDLGAVIAVAGSHPHGALLGLPITDAVKRADKNSRVAASVDRQGLWRALTPQVFVANMLLDALDQCRAAGVTPLDEADAMQFAGFAPRLVAGGAENIKITYPADLCFAERLLRSSRA